MENWKSIGALLSGIAALITAVATLESKDLLPRLNIPPFTIFTTTSKGATLPGSAASAASAASETVKKAVIYDQDGWTNLRQLPTTTSNILQKLYNDEEIVVLGRSGSWYQIKTKSNQIGFVYKTNILFN
jgi:uncharacterized protein YgiM (DUF1202 family)